MLNDSSFPAGMAPSVFKRDQLIEALRYETERAPVWISKQRPAVEDRYQLDLLVVIAKSDDLKKSQVTFKKIVDALGVESKNVRWKLVESTEFANLVSEKPRRILLWSEARDVLLSTEKSPRFALQFEAARIEVMAQEDSMTATLADASLKRQFWTQFKTWMA